MSKVVLVVDDSDATRKFVAFALRTMGYRVITAQDGLEALEKLLRDHVDLVITDLNMPRMDGISLIEEVRGTTNNNRVPILMLTTESQTSFKEKARNAGATGWIVKPFVADNLLAVINKVLR